MEFPLIHFNVPRKTFRDNEVLRRTLMIVFHFSFQYPQPNADVGSLCTGLNGISPFDSLNWAKIPCDYPIFRAGVVCESPAREHGGGN